MTRSPSPHAHSPVAAIVTFILVAFVWAAFGSDAAPASAAGLPPCDSSQLKVTQTFGQYNARVASEIVATNISTVTCALRGSPGMVVLDAAGHPAPFGYIQASGGVTSPLVTLPPGGAARSEWIWWSYCGTPMAFPLSFRIYWLGGGDTLVSLGSGSVTQAPPCITTPIPPFAEILPWAPVGVIAPHDERYFRQTGFRIDDDTILDYFNHRGGITTFGYPISRTFEFQGFVVQFFQRRIVQLDPYGHAQLLNLLDGDLLPYTSFNFSLFPARDPAIAGFNPSIDVVSGHAPDSYQGIPVRFYQTFLGTVPLNAALPAGGDARLLPGFDLEMWGVPTSQPAFDPHNHGIVYLRWQRGVMQYDSATGLTQGVLLADYLKSILTGTNLPADLASEASASVFYRQYDPSIPGRVRDPARLPNTDLTDAFLPQ